MSKGKILFSCSDIYSRGGIQRFNRNLVTAWMNEGYEVYVISLLDSDNHQFVEATRIIVTHGNKLQWIKELSKSLEDDYDAYVCGHVNLAVAFLIALFVRGKLNKNTCLVLHGIEVWGRINGLRKWFVKYFRNVMSVSRYTQNEFIKQVSDKAALAHFIFPNTINPDLYSVDDTVSRSADASRLRILSVARLASSERPKGIPDVLDALALLKNSQIEYRIIGTGNDLEYLKEKVESLGLNNVVFLGAVSDEVMWQEYRMADVFALPSAKEGFGIVFLEAMYFKLPVIGASEKGALDVISDNENGLLVKYADKNQIAAAITKMKSHPDLRQSLGEAGKLLVLYDGKFGFGTFQKRSVNMFVHNQG